MTPRSGSPWSITSSASRRPEPPEKRSWGNFDRAMAQASKITPDNSSLVLMRADRLAMSGKLPEATAILQQAAAKSPRNGSFWIAWASALGRSGRLLEGLEVLERASAPGAAGDRRRSGSPGPRPCSTSAEAGRPARPCSKGATKLPLFDRPTLWEGLGRLDVARGDLLKARDSFTEWSRLLPDDPRPRLALVELALASGDESSVRSTVETLRELGGSSDGAWRLCRAQELLWLEAHSFRPTRRAATLGSPRPSSS